MAYLSSTEATEKSVVEKLAEQAFGRSVGTIVPLGGLIANNFMVDEKFILKLPSERSCIDEWKRAVKNAPILQDHLSVQIPIPTLHVLQHNGQEITALSYERLPGHCISRGMFTAADNTFKKDYFSQLNDKIHELHQIPVDILPVRPPAAFDYAANRLFNQPEQAQVFSSLLKRIFPYQASRECLLHEDLHSENICFDGKNIVGFLDFDLFCVGHPVFEFRPRLCEKKKDIQLMMTDYATRYPDEFSVQTGKDFLKKYDLLFSLFFMMSLLKGKKGKTRFDKLIRKKIQTRLHRG